MVIHAKHCYFGIIEILFRIIFIYRFSVFILGKVLVVYMFLSCLLFLEVIYIYIYILYIDTHKSKYVWLVAAVLYHSIVNFTMYTYYNNILYIYWNVFLLNKHLTHYCRKWSVAHRAAQKKPSGWSSGADHNPSLHTSVWQIFSSSSYLAASAALTKPNELTSPLRSSFHLASLCRRSSD